MSVGIIGSGYVGQKFGKYLLSKNKLVYFYDVSDEVVQDLKQYGFNATSNINDISNSEFFLYQFPHLLWKMDCKILQL